MSRWLALAGGGSDSTTPPFDKGTKLDKITEMQPEGVFCQVLSNCRTREDAKHFGAGRADMRHGFAVSGNPKTWTGSIVSSADR